MKRNHVTPLKRPRRKCGKIIAAKRLSPMPSAIAKRSRRDIRRDSSTSSGFTSARGRGRTSFGAVNRMRQKNGDIGTRYHQACLLYTSDAADEEDSVDR